MKIKRVDLIINPNAGNGRLKEQLQQVVKTLESHFPHVSVHETYQPGDAASYIEDLDNETDLIIGAGGDGTVYEIINALAPLQNRPAFGIIPGGTCNDFSRALGISQNPLEAVEQICNQKFRAIDVGKCNHQYFLNFWGIGLITEVSTNINPRMKESFGRLSYYLSAIQSVNRDRTFKLKLESDECAYEGNAAMVLIGNGPFTGGIRAFFPESNIEDGKLEVLIIESNRLQTFWDMIRAKVMQDIPNSEDILYFQSDHISIETEPNQTIDCDGERDYETPSTISILPRHIQMAVGNYPPLQ
ncbi:diacylglycerol kinase family lipid kinase [Alkalihalobacillus berkeleyi]|uniref:Diacylglycerol kinase family lipid kinase n=1 Tax=Pseudalkalibacillus berkeleyi TaxID=1069813 RepID=A0ABS9GXI9_9BACL|nr:diacylglycerol kinase family protein [Pseudalkalibacillus berkeleyi]MCF6136193.1 diacylglycerol kinase family lipid kinase [Pseudalkalibacillus berkeleyi]